MTLPRRIAKDDKLRKSAASRARILIVDDDERNLMAVSEVLKDLAQVVSATSGQEALRHLLKGEFAVILLDVFMPGMDGYETASLIRARDQTARIPIIFLSAVNKETEHLMRGYAMGAVDYVFKPVDPLILKSKVSVFVDLFNMRAQVEEKSRAEQQLRDANYRAELARLQIARELAMTRERETAILQSLPILLYTEPAEATPRQPDFVSGDFTAMTGFSFNELQLEPDLWEKRLHPEDRQRVMAALEKRSRTGRLSIEYRWLGADGSYRHFLDQAVLVTDAVTIKELKGGLHLGQMQVTRDADRVARSVALSVCAYLLLIRLYGRDEKSGQPWSVFRLKQRFQADLMRHEIDRTERKWKHKLKQFEAAA
jgi:CheY-like chemotaxis protein